MGVEIVVPSVLFITIGVVLGLFFMFRYRSRAELHKTVRNALERGQELTPELIERLGQPRQPANADLRKALIWLAVGLAFVIFGVVLDEREAVRPLIGTGAFPILVGIAYLIMWRFSEKQTSS
jgi:preprotein translocase subunit YajC